MPRRPTLLEMLETRLRLLDGRYVSRGNPPQHEDGPFDGLEPLLPVAQCSDVRALVDKLLQRFERLPYGHVDRHALVGVWPDCRGIAVFGLQPPHESRTPVRERIDGVELSAEALHDGVLERGPKQTNVHLRQMKACHYVRLLVRRCAETSSSYL